MGDVAHRWTSALNRPLSRRDLLKAGATSALLAMLGVDRAHGADRVEGSGGRIVRAAIHPAIGIARVGNSPDEYYFGPEIPGGLPIAPGGYKDAQRSDEASGGALPHLRTRRPGSSCARAHGGRCGDRVDRAPRQQEGVLVPVRDRARHPRGRADLAAERSVPAGRRATRW